MRRTLGVLAVAAMVVLGAAACGGGSDSSSSTTSTSSGSGGGATTAAVTKYCDKVDELATLVAKGRSGSGNYDSEIKALSDELKTLSNDAAKSLATNPGAAKKFGECSLAASKKIAESIKPG